MAKNKSNKLIVLQPKAEFVPSADNPEDTPPPVVCTYCNGKGTVTRLTTIKPYKKEVPCKYCS